MLYTHVFFMCLHLIFFFMNVFVSYRSMYYLDFFISLSAVCLLLQLEAVVHLHQNNIWKNRRNAELNLTSHNLFAIQFSRVLLAKNLMRVKPSSLIYSFLNYIIRVKNLRKINIVKFWMNFTGLTYPICLILQHQICL